MVRILALLENRPVQFGDAEIVDMNESFAGALFQTGYL